MKSSLVYKKCHPYTILNHMKLSVIIIILSVMRQIFITPHGIFDIISSLGISAFYVLAGCLYALWFYHKQSYFMGDNGIFIRQGIFFKRKYVMPYDKIQTLSVKKDILPSIFGAVKVSADTPAGSSRDYDISGYISKKNTEKMLERINRENIKGNIYRSNMVNTILLSVFWSNPITGLIFIVPVLSKSAKIVGSELTNSLIYDSISSDKNFFALYFSPAVSAIITIIILCWVISVLMVFLRYAGFRSYRLENFVAVSRGAINKSFLMTRTDGITAVTINQSLFMRILNIYSAGIFVIGSDKIKGDRSMIIPPEGKEKIYKGIYELTGIDPHETESIYVRKHKLWSYVYLPVILFAVCTLGFILSKFLGRLSSIIRVLSAICMLLILWWFAFRCFAYRHSHIALCGRNISVCTYERLTLKKYIIPIEKIQSVEISQNIFQLKKDTCNVKLSIYAEKKTSHRIKQLDRKTAKKLIEKLVY